MLDDIEYDVSVAHSASTFEILVTIANDITQISCFVKCFMNGTQRAEPTIFISIFYYFSDKMT